MDDLILRRINRLLHDVKHQIGDMYGVKKEDELNDIQRSPKVKYTKELEKSNDSTGNIMINDSFLHRTTPRDESLLTNNNTIELVTVKLIEPPVKNTTQLPKNNKLTIKETNLNNLNQSLNDSSIFDVKINEKEEKLNVKNKQSVIKVKIIVPKGSLNGIQNEAIDIVPEIDNKCIFEENRSCPLSPINRQLATSKPTTEILPKTVQTPEKNSPIQAVVKRTNLELDPCKSLFRHSVPIMGRAALMSKASRKPDRSTLEDSATISTLVRERFLVNGFHCSYSVRSTIRTSPRSRLYRSLDGSRRRNTIRQSSPIKIQMKNEEVQTNVSFIQEEYDKDLVENLVLERKEDEMHTKLEENVSTPEDAVETHIELLPNLEESNIFIVQQNHQMETLKRTFAAVEEESNEILAPNNSPSSTPPQSSATMEIHTFDEDQKPGFPSMEDLPSLPSFENASSLGDLTVFDDVQSCDSEPTYNELFETAKGDEDKQKEDNTVATEASSYDMDEFLKKALGDELLEDENTTLNSTDQDYAKPTKPKKDFLPDDSICTSDASELMSKLTSSVQSRFYHSLSRKLRDMGNSLRHSLPKPDESKSEIDLESVLPNSDVVDDLIKQASVQYESMRQISKALTLCRYTKEFCGSDEQVEGERLLLVANHKRQALLSEIRRLDYDFNYEKPYCSCERGTLSINGINFPLKRSNENSPGPINRRDFVQWFVCVVSQGPRVLATQAQIAKDHCPVVFPEEFTFTELPSDFVVNIEVFSLQQKRNIRDYNSRFHLNKTLKNTHCPKPFSRSLLHKDKNYSSKTLSRCDTGILVSSFKSVGILSIKVSDISKPGPWQLTKIPISSDLYGIINMTITTRVSIPVRFSGFLTVGTKNINTTTSWNRRWCVLDSHLLKFWNYPCEEDSSEPLEIVDLKLCVIAKVAQVDRSVCPRPRTLVLETAKTNGTKNFNTFFFQADAISDMRIWSDQLNKVIAGTRIWNDSYFRK